MATYPPNPYPTYPPPPQQSPYPPSTPTSTYPPQPNPSPFTAVVPSPHVQFPPGTDPNAIACFTLADEDRKGVVDEKELQKGLSLHNHTFNLRTCRLLIILYTSSKDKKLDPVEFVQVYNCLTHWKANFERFDTDRNGKIDGPELSNALMSIGYAVTPKILDVLMAKFGKSSGNTKFIEYDNYIDSILLFPHFRCCLTVKGLSDKFKELDTTLCGSVTFTYEHFLLTVIPFMTA